MQKFLLPLVLAVYGQVPAFAQAPTSSDQRSSLINVSDRNADSPRLLTLNVVLEWALKTNPDIAAAIHEVEAQEGAVRQAAILPNPEFFVTVEDTQKSTRTTTLQINQRIELNGKRVARMALAERNRGYAETELAIKRADIRAAAVTAFYDVLTSQERHQLAFASVEIAQRASSVAAKRVIAGKISPVEETKARIAESSVRIELAQAASELISARKRLAAIWGSTTPQFERAEGQINLLPSLPAMNDLKQRLRQSPNFIRARNEVERRQAMLQVERARQIPDVTFSIGAKREEQLRRNQAIVGLSIPLPLFDRNQGNMQEALRRTDKARDELTATEVRLSSDLAQAHERLNAARQEAELLQRDILPGAQSAYEAAVKGFEFGKFNFLDVLDAQRTLLQAKSQTLRTLYEAHRAAAEIDRILGEPSSNASTMPLAIKP